MEENYEPMLDPEQVGFDNQMLKNKNAELAGALSSSGFQMEDTQNLVQYKLETDKILERVEHFLKGDQVKFNDDGAYFAEPTKNVLAIVKKAANGIKYFIQEVKEPKKGTEEIREVLVRIENKNKEVVDVMEVDSKRILKKLEGMKLANEGYKYIQVIDESKKPLNDYGVAELMRIMSTYITKETFLSRYSEDRINEIMSDLGNELNKFMYCNYEKMGMDTKFKESKYALIIINLLHVVESCYRRALGGAEQSNLITKSIITQNEGVGGYGPSGGMKQKWNPLKPKTW
jgi:hypothetical protein